MEVALRQRLDGVAKISISQSQQTAAVEFTGLTENFSPKAFREAVGKSGVRVVSFDIDACGVIEQDKSERWLVAGKSRFQLADGGTAAPIGRPLCLSGRLEERSGSDRFTIIRVEADAQQ